MTDYPSDYILKYHPRFVTENYENYVAKSMYDNPRDFKQYMLSLSENKRRQVNGRLYFLYSDRVGDNEREPYIVPDMIKKRLRAVGYPFMEEIEQRCIALYDDNTFPKNKYPRYK